MDTILWAVPFLLATCLLDSPADACSCAPAHPQQAFCTSDLAFRARVLSRNLEDIPETHLYATPLQIARYDLEDVKIIKGADKVSSLKHVYSPPSDFMCGVELMEDTEYLLTGRLNGDKVHIGLCDLVRPWVELIPSQQQNVLKYYQLGCSCRIMTCFSLPCSVFADDECLWTDLVQNEHKDGYQARNFACLPQPHLPTLCSWHHGMAPALDEAEDDYDYEEERPEPLLARARPDFYPPGTKYNRLVI